MADTRHNRRNNDNKSEFYEAMPANAPAYAYRDEDHSDSKGRKGLGTGMLLLGLLLGLIAGLVLANTVDIGTDPVTIPAPTVQID